MDFDTSKPGKLMLNMCIPSVITILVMQIYHMADVFFIGKLDSPAMVSGLSLASPIIAILSTVGVLVGGGGCAALAMALGRKDDISAKRIVAFSFWSSIGLGAIVGVLLLAFTDKLVSFFGASSEASLYCRHITASREIISSLVARPKLFKLFNPTSLFVSKEKS